MTAFFLFNQTLHHHPPVVYEVASQTCSQFLWKSLAQGQRLLYACELCLPDPILLIPLCCHFWACICVPSSWCSADAFASSNECSPRRELVHAGTVHAREAVGCTLYILNLWPKTTTRSFHFIAGSLCNGENDPPVGFLGCCIFGQAALAANERLQIHNLDVTICFLSLKYTYMNHILYTVDIYVSIPQL